MHVIGKKERVIKQKEFRNDEFCVKNLQQLPPKPSPQLNQPPPASWPPDEGPFTMVKTALEH
jgi:hypothetical protein